METKRKKWFGIFFSRSTFKSFGNTNRNIKMIQVYFALGKGYIPERENARNQQTCPAKVVGVRGLEIKALYENFFYHRIHSF